MKTDHFTMGRFFREARLKTTPIISQAEVAIAFNVKPQFVSNWERGKSNPPRKFYKKLVKILAVNPERVAERASSIAYSEAMEAMK